MTQHLLFDAAGLDLAAPADVVEAIHEELSIQSVSGTKRWFLGLAVAHGKLLPVTDLGAFSGRRSSTRRTLELNPATGIAGLSVDDVIGLSSDPTMDISACNNKLVSINNSRLTLTGRAIVRNERTYCVLDVAALVQSGAFLNIAESDD